MNNPYEKIPEYRRRDIEACHTQGLREVADAIKAAAILAQDKADYLALELAFVRQTINERINNQTITAP